MTKNIIFISNNLQKLLLFSLIFLTIVTLSGCEEAPTLPNNKENKGIRVEFKTEIPIIERAGTTLTFTIEASSEKGLSKLEVMIDNQVIDQGERIYTDKCTFSSEEFSYTIDSQLSGSTLQLFAQATDTEGNVFYTERAIYIQPPLAQISITLPGTEPQEEEVGKEVKFDVEIISEVDLAMIQTFLNGAEILALRMNSFPSASTAIYPFSYTSQLADIGKTLNFEIRVTDILSNELSKSYSLKIKATQASDIKIFNGITIGYNRNTQYGQFLNAIEGTTHTIAEAKLISESIDLACFFSNNAGAGASLAQPTYTGFYSAIYNQTSFPNDYIGSWNTINVTELKTLSDLDVATYGNITSSDQLNTYYEATSASVATAGVVNRLQENSLFGFKTASGKIAIVKVSNRGTNNMESITIDYKIQK